MINIHTNKHTKVLLYIKFTSVHELLPGV